MNLSDKVMFYGFTVGSMFAIFLGISLAFGDHSQMADEYVNIITRLVYTVFITTFFISVFLQVSGKGEEER